MNAYVPKSNSALTYEQQSRPEVLSPPFSDTLYMLIDITSTFCENETYYP